MVVRCPSFSRGTTRASVGWASRTQRFRSQSRSKPGLASRRGSSDGVWRVVAAVALLGNIGFVAGADEARVEVAEALEVAAAALGTDGGALREVLSTRRVKVAGDETATALTPKAAARLRKSILCGPGAIA